VTVLRESLTFGMGLGFLLVLAGSTLATRRRAAAVAPSRVPEARAGEAL